MKRALIAALSLALLAPAGAVAADEPQVICTRVAVPPGHILDDSYALRGEPFTGDCEVLIYLPVALVDGLMLGSLVEAAEEAEQADMGAEWLAEHDAGVQTMSCRELGAVIREEGSGPAWDAAVLQKYRYCFDCSGLKTQLSSKAGTPEGDIAAILYRDRCEPE